MFIDVNKVDSVVRLGLPSLDDYDNGTVVAMDVDDTGCPSDLYTLNEVTLHLQERNIERTLAELEFDDSCWEAAA
jgi:hypothetical protein